MVVVCYIIFEIIFEMSKQKPLHHCPDVLVTETLINSPFFLGSAKEVGGIHEYGHDH
jgi:hypothetical protein